MKLGLALTVCLFVFESSSAELAKSPPAEENLPSYEGMFLYLRYFSFNIIKIWFKISSAKFIGYFL